jgi:glycosyltransferase involved in cell wall biosynthesis
MLRLIAKIAQPVAVIKAMHAFPEPAPALSGSRLSRSPALHVGSAGSTSSMLSGRIRVLIVTARFFPDLGGTETHVYEVTRRMASNKNLDLTVLTTDRSRTLPPREELHGFTLLRCRAYPRHRDYYFAPGVYWRILRGNYDLVHCQGIHTAVPIIAMIAAKQRRIPYVVTLHTGGHSSRLRRRLRKFQWQALGPLLRGAAAVVAVSRFEQRLFQKICFLDTARFKIIQNGAGLTENEVRTDIIPGRIVSCGRLERYKGHQRIVEALPIVQRSVPEATLHILGSGPYESRLRSLIRTLGLEESVTIEYIAPDDRQRMATSLGAAAVATALSEYESNPVAVMEALALGVPTIGLDTAGMGDLVEDGLARGVTKDASPTAIAQALIDVLRHQSTNDLPALPTWDAIAADLVDVYLNSVKAATGPLRDRSARMSRVSAKP